MLNNRLNITLWVACLILYGWTVIWLMPRSFFNMVDPFIIDYQIMALAKGGVAHLGFVDLMRPGYLINMPFYLMGMSFDQLRYLSIVLLFISAVCLYIGFRPETSKPWMLPLCLLVLYGCFLLRFRFQITYYESIFGGLMVAFGCFYQSLRSHWAWLVGVLLGFWLMFTGSVISGICALGCVALLVICYPQRRHFVMAIFFYVVCAVAAYVYFIDWGVLARVATEVGTLSPIKNMSFTEYAAVLLGLYLLAIAAAVVVGYLVRRNTLLRQCLFNIALLTIPFVFLGAEQSNRNALLAGLAAFVLADVIMRAACIRGWRVALLPVCVYGTWLATAVAATSTNLFYAYWPMLLLWMFFLQYQGLCFEKSERMTIVVAMALLVILAIANSFVDLNSRLHGIGHRGQPTSMILNNTEKGILGFYMPPEQAAFYRQLTKLYDQHNCGQKAFLAFYYMPEAYLMFNRLAPFNNSYISIGVSELYDRLSTGENLTAYLKSHGHWCVAYRAYPEQVLGDAFLHRAKLKRFLAENSAITIPLLRHSRFLPVTFFVG